MNWSEFQLWFTRVQLDNELFKWSLESTHTFLLDQRLGCLSDQPDPKVQEVIQATDMIAQRLLELMSLPVKLTKIIMRPQWKNLKHNVEVLRNYNIKRIEDRLRELEANPTPEAEEASFLEYLIRHPDMSRKEVLANLSAFLHAAIRTTSSTLLAVLYELARNPEVQQRLYEEVTKAVPPGSEVKASDLQEVPYLKAVIKEAMRLYPVSSAISRVLPEDSVILGYQIPKGKPVVANLYAVGRMESVFPEPETFRPERWLRDRDQTGDSRVHPFASLPFGFGPRMCVGRRIAELEMQILLVKLVSKCRVEPVSPLSGPMPLKMQLLLVPEHPVEVRLVDR